ncbi:domain of Kin17 curved DNA-binding protein-domain-containing protein [Lipomyces oligophaga]|uniref:domain of Kin17 curved DNA-binding protein-domain-containing protein n=1 Tax=Lipomyces oligophaga TaxID=45792 RepID=UPI0034CD70EF
MGRAEVGTPKYIANKMKAKGLQRLRWYCQVCEKQCRDENGFKCHTQSESHVRQMLLVGENTGAKIADFSAQFRRDFVSLLRSSHGEKPINANKFYQEYIHDRNHIHMNATKYATLSQFVKMLGDEGVCRVEEDTSSREGGYTVAYIDNSPEALKRRELAAKRDRYGQDDLQQTEKDLQRQIKRAIVESESKKSKHPEQESAPKELLRIDEKPIKLGFSLSKKSTLKSGAIQKPKKIKLK